MWEWVWGAGYHSGDDPDAPQLDPPLIPPGNFPIRGGGYYYGPPTVCRSASYWIHTPGNRFHDRGFRLARTLHPDPQPEGDWDTIEYEVIEMTGEFVANEE